MKSYLVLRYIGLIFIIGSIIIYPIINNHEIAKQIEQLDKRKIWITRD